MRGDMRIRFISFFFAAVIGLFGLCACGNEAAPAAPVAQAPPPSVPVSVPVADPVAEAPAPIATPAPLPAVPGAKIAPAASLTGDLAAVPEALPENRDLTGRRQAWLTENFRCRAISTVRLRKCRFEETEGGYRLRFNKKDVICEDVVFDSDGNPSELTGCRSNWLRVPSNNRLTADTSGNIWSGSTSGWRWKSDGDPYCCPGLWLEAPASLKK